MRLKFNILVAAILLSNSPSLFSGWAADAAMAAVQGQVPGQQGGDLSLIKKYIANLGKYMGYDISTYCAGEGQCGDDAKASANLVNVENTQLAQLNIYSQYLATLLGGEQNPILPKSVSNIVNYAGKAYPEYDKPDGGTAAISISALVDQKAYQPDPVNQAILNILSTPDNSFCLQNTVTEGGVNPCDSLSRQDIITIPWTSKQSSGAAPTDSQALPTVTFPSAAEVFMSAQNQPILPQLNSNTLIMPLLYTKSQDEGNPKKDQSGLVAKTQAQQAANFVRYVTGLVSPISTANFDDYVKQYTAASITSAGTDEKTATIIKNKAQTILADYLLRLRMYAAQSSVAIGNIYYILSRRLPLDDKGETSEALSEFKMASWRLYDSKSEDPKDAQAWLTKIQSASTATTQKEIAVLLAEINYQLYLTRQQNERMLLTQSVALLQMARFAAPNPKLDQPQVMP